MSSNKSEKYRRISISLEAIPTATRKPTGCKFIQKAIKNFFLLSKKKIALKSNQISATSCIEYKPLTLNNYGFTSNEKLSLDQFNSTQNLNSASCNDFIFEFEQDCSNNRQLIESQTEDTENNLKKILKADTFGDEIKASQSVQEISEKMTKNNEKFKITKNNDYIEILNDPSNIPSTDALNISSPILEHDYKYSEIAAAMELIIDGNVENLEHFGESVGINESGILQNLMNQDRNDDYKGIAQSEEKKPSYLPLNLDDDDDNEDSQENLSTQNDFDNQISSELEKSNEAKLYNLKNYNAFEKPEILHQLNHLEEKNNFQNSEDNINLKPIFSCEDKNHFIGLSNVEEKIDSSAFEQSHLQELKKEKTIQEQQEYGYSDIISAMEEVIYAKANLIIEDDFEHNIAIEQTAVLPRLLQNDASFKELNNEINKNALDESQYEIENSIGIQQEKVQEISLNFRNKNKQNNTADFPIKVRPNEKNNFDLRDGVTDNIYSEILAAMETVIEENIDDKENEKSECKILKELSDFDVSLNDENSDNDKDHVNIKVTQNLESFPVNQVLQKENISDFMFLTANINKKTVEYANLINAIEKVAEKTSEEKSRLIAGTKSENENDLEVLTKDFIEKSKKVLSRNKIYFDVNNESKTKADIKAETQSTKAKKSNLRFDLEKHDGNHKIVFPNYETKQKKINSYENVHFDKAMTLPLSLSEENDETSDYTNKNDLSSAEKDNDDTLNDVDENYYFFSSEATQPSVLQNTDCRQKMERKIAPIYNQLSSNSKKREKPYDEFFKNKLFNLEEQILDIKQENFDILKLMRKISPKNVLNSKEVRFDKNLKIIPKKCEKKPPRQTRASSVPPTRNAYALPSQKIEDLNLQPNRQMKSSPDYNYKHIIEDSLRLIEKANRQLNCNQENLFDYPRKFNSVKFAKFRQNLLDEKRRHQIERTSISEAVSMETMNMNDLSKMLHSEERILTQLQRIIGNIYVSPFSRTHSCNHPEQSDLYWKSDDTSENVTYDNEEETLSEEQFLEEDSTRGFIDDTIENFIY